MIIDGHTHIFTEEMVNNKQKYCDDRQFSLLYYGNARIATAEMLVQAMECDGVDISVAMGFTWQREEYARQHNEYLQWAQITYSKKIYAFGSIALEGNLYDQIHHIKELGLYGIGEVAFYALGYGKHEEEILHEILHIAEKFRLPVCVHVNEPLGHTYSGKYYTDFRSLYSILSEHSGVPIICSHWGGGMFVYELMKEVKQSLSHVFYDTAATPFLYSPEIYTVGELCAAKKIIFGSDFPLLSCKRYLDDISSHVNNTEPLFFENIKTILKL